MRPKEDVDGISVIALDTGAKIGEVDDLIFDLQQNRLIGILVEKAGLTHPARVVPCSQVRAIGPDAVMVEGENSVIDAEKDAYINDILQKEREIKGKEVYTMEGEDLGEIVDVHFDEKTGKIEGYEVSGGIFADAYTGRSFIPAPKTLKIGKDVVLVPSEVASMVEQQVGGIRGAARRVGEKTQAAEQKLTDKARDLRWSAHERATGRGAEDLVDQAQGKRAEHDVYADDGTMFVIGGQLIEERDVVAARQHHKERELLESAGIGTGAEWRAAAGKTWETRKRQAGEAATSARARASGLIEQARDRLLGWKEQASDKVETQRIHRALGRPVTRVILDRNDEVILNTGDIITHKAIEEARRANMLDALLGSVHVENDPTKEELKAPTEGSASLKKH
jgi:uncharacterized protein YrrD